MHNDEEKRLYVYLLKNFPLRVNSHNAILGSGNSGLKHTAEDVAIFIFEQLKKQYDIKLSDEKKLIK